MAIKKSDLYSSLWASCDELRGGMDASQYKDYVLFMLFIKYISDKYGNSDDFAPPVTIPKGASFKDMIALKGKPDIGDKINTQVIQPLIDANARLARSDFPDFNDPNRLGEGQAMVDRLTNLVGIFQKPELDFSQNRAEHDDKREATVIYNNLPDILALARGAAPAMTEAHANYGDLVDLALKIDRVMRERAPAGWKGDQAREAQVLNALFPLLNRNRDATLALFELVKNQPGY